MTTKAFRDALHKLRINDAALQVEPENSEALGLGFRCGFLGMLHMEIVQERLESEYDLSLITTAPTVIYRIEMKNNTLLSIDNPADLPTAAQIKCWNEPMVKAHILVPADLYWSNHSTLY